MTRDPFRYIPDVVRVVLLALVLMVTAHAQNVFFREACDSANFSARGWYDNDRIVISGSEHIPGSAGSLEFRFLKGATTPTTRGGVRRLFTPSDSVYVSYWVKYSANWEGSNRPYHPHEFHLLTNIDSRWIGPAATHLTTYIEQNEGRPLLAIQDALNIDAGRIGQDLSTITEQRAVAGCNGTSDRYPAGDCYRAGADYRNGKVWHAPRVCFGDSAGTYNKNDWHFVEAFFKLNTIVGGKGVPDGVVRYWFDGAVMIDAPDVMLRTAALPGMSFNQFMIAPYIGDGSPVEQTMWVDEITVADTRPRSTYTHHTDPAPLPQLAQNHPNPFSGSTRIRYTLHAASTVTLVVHDQLGRIVHTLVDTQQPAGAHVIEFNTETDASPLANGLYLLRLTTPHGSSTRVMAVCR